MASLRNYRRFYALLKAAKVEASEKSSLARVYSEGRTESLRELTDKEWKELIRHLEGSAKAMVERDVRDRKRKKVIAIFAAMGYTYKYNHGTSNIEAPDMAAIYKTIQQKGCHKPKHLNDYSSEELSDLIYQFEKIKDFYNEKQKINDIVSSLWF